MADSSPQIFLDNIPIVRIIYPVGANNLIRLAAEELRKYLMKSLNLELDMEAGAPSPGAFFLSNAGCDRETIAELGGFRTDRYDQCIVAGKDDRIFFVGENDLSVLYAVYDFLKRYLDIRFFAPGENYEYVPKCSSLRLERQFVFRSDSKLETRDFINRANHPDVLSFAAKNRINVIKVGVWADESHVDVIRAYGFKARGPGHSWSNFVPDESLFDKHPEYFPLLNGKRTVTGRTACFSNPEVRKIFFTNLRDYLRRGPHWDIFAFWAEDVPDLHYCECSECRKMETTDWYMTLVNEAAKIVEQELPDAIFELIAYRATCNPPKQVRKLYRDGKNMLVDISLGYQRDLFNPLSKKTYGSAEVFQQYANWRKYLSEVGFRGKIILMEYYNLCEPPNSGPSGRALLWPMEVIKKDVKFYREDGLNGLGAYTGFDCLCWPSPFNTWSWIRLWNDPDVELETLKDDFYPKYFGKFGSAARQYMDRLEKIMHEKTSRKNLAKLVALSELLESIPGPDGAGQEKVRLNLLRIHYQYCVLLKKIFLAFLENNFQEWQSLVQLYMTFFDDYQSDLKEHMLPFPPRWVSYWFYHVKLKEGETPRLNDPRIMMLR